MWRKNPSASERLIPIAAALIFASLVPAHAADLRRPPPVEYKAPTVSIYNWSGLYVKGMGSYSADVTGALTQLGTGLGASTIDLNQIPHGPGLGGGLEGLYQAQGSNWVIGLDADASWMNLKATGAVSNGIANQLLFSNATNWLGAVNAVVGYAVDPKLLVGVEGGWAVGGVNPSLAFLTTSTSTTTTQSGYDVGGFLDYAFLPGVVVGIEGRYTHLEDVSLTLPGNTVTTAAKTDIFSELVHLKIRFAGGQ